MNEKRSGAESVCFVSADYSCLRVVVNAADLHLFLMLLQHGFYVFARTGDTVKSMLCERFGVDPAYAVERIKTIFLDGKPVDDMEKATIKDGCTLALSAAMPGLVGATFRSGGVLSPFRAGISYRPEECEVLESKEASVRLKLFNLLVREMGPAFLEKGIFVEKRKLEDFIGHSGINLVFKWKTIELDDKPIDAQDLVKEGIAGNSEFVCLKVTQA